MESCCVPPEKRIKTPTSCILVSFGGAFLLFENPSTHTKLEAKKDFNLQAYTCTCTKQISFP